MQMLQIYPGMYFLEIHHFTQPKTSTLLGHHFHHLAADLPDLRGLRVAVGLHLIWATLGEGDAKHPDHIAIGGLHIHVGLSASGEIQLLEILVPPIHQAQDLPYQHNSKTQRPQ